MNTVKEITVGGATYKVEFNGNATWFFSANGVYENGSEWSDTHGAYNTVRKALNAMKKHMNCLNVEFA